MLCLLPLVAACTKPVSQTSVKISRLSFAGKSSFINMAVWAKSSTGLVQGVFVQTGQSQSSLELPQGDWSFYVIAWDGAGFFEGTPSCGQARKQLSSREESVEITIQASGCGDPNFSNAAHLAASSFLPAKLIRCADPVSGATAGSTCDASPGTMGSYKVIMTIQNREATQWNDGMYSTCQSSFATSASTSPLRLPVTSANPAFPAIIQTFASSDCSGTAKRHYILPKGFGGGDTSDVAVRSSGGYTEIFVHDVGTGTTPNLTPTPSPTPTPTPAPTISTVSPTSGPLAGGHTLTINGTNFLPGPSVDVGGTACTGVTFVSSTQLTCTVPALGAGTYSVIVTNSDAQSATLSSSYSAIPAPAVTSVSPTSGAMAGGQTLTITGSGFSAGASVDVGGSACTSVTVNSATQITCTTPALAAGSHAVAVTNVDTQSGSLVSAFTSVAPPTVTGVTSSMNPGAYTVGASIDVVVTFSASVTVAGGTPHITMETGAIDRNATYTGGSGTTSLTFTYTVAAGDTTGDLDYTSASAYSYNGSSLMDAVGNAVTVTLPTPGLLNSFSANEAIVVDTTAPTAPAVDIPSGLYQSAFTVNFSGSTDSNAFSYYYTLNGVSPTCASSTGSTAPISTAGGGTLTTLMVIACDAAGNQSSITTRTYRSVTPTVIPFYVNAPNWMDYVTTKGDPNSTICSGTGPCYHGGMTRKVVLTGVTSCSGLSMTDSLSAFHWACDASSGTATFYNKSFQSGKGLANLLTIAPSWQNMSVSLTGTQVIGSIASSPTAPYGNALALLPNSSSVAQTITTSGTIFVYNASQNSMGLKLNASKIAIVNLNPSAVITTGGSANCNDALAPTPLNALCGIVSKNFNYLWLENVSLSSATLSASIGVHLATAKYATLNDVTIKGFEMGLRLMTVSQSTFSGIRSDMAGANGVDSNGSDENLFTKVSVGHAGDIGFFLSTSNRNRVLGTRVFNTKGTGYGLSVDTSDDNVIVDATITSNSGTGLEVYLASNNVFQDVTTANNLSEGVLIYGGGIDNSFIRLASFNNDYGIHSNFSSNVFRDLALGHNGTMGIQLDFQTNASSFHGHLRVGNNGTDCWTDSATDPEGLVDATCAPAYGSTHTLYTALSFVSSFAGSTAMTLAYSGLTSFFTNVTAPRHAWGKSGTFGDFTSRSSCDTSLTCEVYDWSVDPSDTNLRNVLPVPTGSSTFTHTWSDASTTTFVVNARETHPYEAIAKGNSNGLCESNEACLHTPNIASDQGNSTLMYLGTLSGTVTGADLYYYP